MRAALVVLAAAFGVSSSAFAQDGVTTNSVGMQFVRIAPGSMIVGHFEPPYPKPPTAEQRAAMAARRVSAGTMSPLLMRSADRNGDGRSSADEWTAAGEQLFSGITSGNPEVFRPEFADRLTRALGVPRYGQPAYNDPVNAAARSAVPRMFNLADQDKNGSLSRAEFTRLFASWFGAWDTNADGVLGPDEISSGLDKALPAPPPAPELTADDYAKAEKDAKASYRPGFRVDIPLAYDIGRYEVTQGQWKKVMGTNPSVFPLDKSRADADEYPVDSVTWDQAQDFVRRLNALEKTTAYRLPSEFEWEYAARGGATDDIAWPKIREQAHMGLGRYKETAAVGTMQPNAWGLYDTLGNVWEWVQNFYNEKLFADPRPPRTGKVHVLKGSGFLGDVKNATYLTHAAGPANGYDVGFRIVRATRQN